jgi:hypothetical protein
LGLKGKITKQGEDQREREEKTIKKKKKERRNMFVRAGKKLVGPFWDLEWEVGLTPSFIDYVLLSLK